MPTIAYHCLSFTQGGEGRGGAGRGRSLSQLKARLQTLQQSSFASLSVRACNLSAGRTPTWESNPRPSCCEDTVPTTVSSGLTVRPAGGLAARSCGGMLLSGEGCFLGIFLCLQLSFLSYFLSSSSSFSPPEHNSKVFH